MELLGIIMAFWFLIGFLMVIASRSRGLLADAIFIFTWPIHLIAHLLGKE
jgi:hypothetical protein